MKTPEEILKDFGITIETQYHSYKYLYKSAVLAMKLYAEQKLQQHAVMRPAGESGSEGEPLPAEGHGEANTCAANFRMTKNGICVDCLKPVIRG